MSSDEQEGQISKNDSQFSVDLKTNKIKKRTKKKKLRKTPKIISSSYKKQRCLHFNKGNCTKGQLCTFSHDFEPDSKKTICKYFLSNACSKGSQCKFSHSIQEYPCKFFHLQNRCNQNELCRFSHQAVSRQYIGEFIKDNKDLMEILCKDQRINLIPDKNLRRQILSFISNETVQEQTRKKQGFKGELKLLAQNNIQIVEQPSKPKLVDPRLKMRNQLKVAKPLKLQQRIKYEASNCGRNWITQLPQRSHQQKYRVLDLTLLQKFLYSYY